MPAGPVDAHLLRQVQLQAAAASWGHLFAVTAATPTAGAAGDRRRRPGRGAVHVHPRRAGRATSRPATPAPTADARSRPSSDRDTARRAAQRAPARQGRRATADKSEPAGAGLPSPVAQRARREEDRRAPVLEPQRRRRPQREGVGRPAVAPRRQVAVFTDTRQEPLALHAHHGRREVTQTPSLVIVEPRGQGRGPDRLLDYQTIDQFVRTRCAGAKQLAAVASTPVTSVRPSVAGLLDSGGVHRFEQHLSEPHGARAGARRRVRRQRRRRAPAATSCGSRCASEDGRIADVDLRRRGLRRDARGRQRLRARSPTARRCSTPRAIGAARRSPPSWAACRRASATPPTSPPTRCTARSSALAPAQARSPRPTAEPRAGRR